MLVSRGHGFLDVGVLLALRCMCTGMTRRLVGKLSDLLDLGNR
jgi:hypothetical protein